MFAGQVMTHGSPAATLIRLVATGLCRLPSFNLNSTARWVAFTEAAVLL